VILIGPDHFRAGRGPVSLCGADWETPFGPLSADPAAATLVSSGLALRQDGIFPGEHGMTVHLPLIRRFFPGASVLPLILRGNVSDLQLLALRKFLLPLAREGGLVLLSMDLSHRKLPPEAAREDDRTLPVLLGLRPRSLTGLDLDCPRGAALFLSLMKELGADDPTLLERSDSGTLSGRLGEPCTSYATILYRFR
jgi:AmmeMemoRadiSam system protein B